MSPFVHGPEPAQSRAGLGPGRGRKRRVCGRLGPPAPISLGTHPQGASAHSKATSSRHRSGDPRPRHTPIASRVTMAPAGLLARASPPCGPAFPVAQWRDRAAARRLQLRGQPRPRPEGPTVFPLASPRGEPSPGRRLPSVAPSVKRVDHSPAGEALRPVARLPRGPVASRPRRDGPSCAHTTAWSPPWPNPLERTPFS